MQKDRVVKAVFLYRDGSTKTKLGQKGQGSGGSVQGMKGCFRSQCSRFRCISFDDLRLKAACFQHLCLMFDSDQRPRGSSTCVWSTTPVAVICFRRIFRSLNNVQLSEKTAKVGMTRFELATPCTPCKCATGLRYIPN